MKIFYQGLPGSFSSIATKQFFNGKGEYIGVKTFAEIFAKLKKPQTFGVIPIENTIAGSIHENYDLLYKHNVEIVGELSLHIEHNLLGVKGAGVKTLKKVFSHYKALEQCQNFFSTHTHVEEVVYFDTAGAAEYVAQEKNKEIAAIASKEAAHLYGLQILNANIEDNPKNLTRFLVISNKLLIKKTKTLNTNNQSLVTKNKCSLLFTVTHAPHSLQLVLTILANANCNLTKIESRPLIGKPFEYLFYVDFEFDPTSRKKVEQTLTILATQQPFFKNLGFYSRGE